MTRNPPFSLDDRTLEEVLSTPAHPASGRIELAVGVDELKVGCDCISQLRKPEPKPRDPDPDLPDDLPEDPDWADPTTIESYDKWWLKQCRTCGGIFWRHDVKADYGDPRMDIR